MSIFDQFRFSFVFFLGLPKNRPQSLSLLILGYDATASSNAPWGHFGIERSVRPSVCPSVYVSHDAAA